MICQILLCAHLRPVCRMICAAACAGRTLLTPLRVKTVSAADTGDIWSAPLQVRLIRTPEPTSRRHEIRLLICWTGWSKMIDVSNIRARLPVIGSTMASTDILKASIRGGTSKADVSLDYIQYGRHSDLAGPIYKNKPVQGGTGSEKLGYHGYWITILPMLYPLWARKA